jgi:hypothetical protein
LVISNHARLPGVIVRGKESPPKDRPYAGMLFYWCGPIVRFRSVLPCAENQMCRADQDSIRANGFFPVQATCAPRACRDGGCATTLATCASALIVRANRDRVSALTLSRRADRLPRRSKGLRVRACHDRVSALTLYAAFNHVSRSLKGLIVGASAGIIPLNRFLRRLNDVDGRI